MKKVVEQLTDSEIATLTHCLRVAADQFDRDVEIAKTEVNDGGRLAFTFANQAITARAWADKLDNAEQVSLVDGQEQ